MRTGHKLFRGLIIGAKIYLSWAVMTIWASACQSGNLKNNNILTLTLLNG